MTFDDAEKRVALASDQGSVPRHILLSGQGLSLSDPDALPLVHKKPAMLSSWSVATLSGQLVNTGKDSTPPIEVYSVTTSGYGDRRKQSRVAKPLGSIAPGNSAKYALTVGDFNYYGDSPNASFRADGKRLAVFNEYAHEHTLDALTMALGVRARHGVWVEHGDWRRDALAVVVRITAEQAALDDGARGTLFGAVVASLRDHQRKFHRNAFSSTRVLFAAPGGGGWILALGKKTVRYEGALEEQLKGRF